MISTGEVSLQVVMNSTHTHKTRDKTRLQITVQLIHDPNADTALDTS